MIKNKIYLSMLFLLIPLIWISAKPIGYFILSDTTLTNADTLSLTIVIDNNNIKSGLWIHDINTVTDSLKMYFYVSDYKDSSLILVDSCMNTGFKLLDLNDYVPTYLHIKAFVADSSATLQPKLIMTHVYDLY